METHEQVLRIGPLRWAAEIRESGSVVYTSRVVSATQSVISTQLRTGTMVTNRPETLARLAFRLAHQSPEALVEDDH